jgi:hypothetical protein
MVVFDCQNTQCMVNLCNKSPMLPHKCHPPIEISSQLINQATGLSNNDVSLTMAHAWTIPPWRHTRGEIAGDAVKVSNKE